MSKPSLREQLRRRKESRKPTQTNPSPPMGHVVAKPKRRADEPEPTEEAELDGIMSEAGGWLP